MLVSNTSTLVLLAKATLLEKFVENSPTIAIPEEVQDEYTFNDQSYYAKRIDKIMSSGDIIVKKAEKDKLDKIMEEFALDIGEAAAYQLYKQADYDAILTDDGELIKLCKLEEIPFITAPAAVVRLCEKCPISKETASEKLGQLKQIGRYARDIYKHFQKQIQGIEK